MNLKNSPLCISLGETPTLQVLSFLLAHRDFDYSKTELAKNLEVSRQTIYKALEPLLKFEMVVNSRKIGNTTLYKLNQDSDTVNAIQRYNESIVNIIVNLEMDIKIEKYKNIDDDIKQFKKEHISDGNE